MGMFEGNLEEGELEIGQASSLLCGKGIQTVEEVVNDLQKEYAEAWDEMLKSKDAPI